MKKLILAALVGASLWVTMAQAHSGGTDAYGCHYDRKTGIYHCH